LRSKESTFRKALCKNALESNNKTLPPFSCQDLKQSLLYFADKVYSLFVASPGNKNYGKML
jgi:hypothetical protein